ncbi:hypothetical protein FOMG_16794 [Fusarium oxysporum f. sp. melonis 26406]|uniref:Zn(2)-C6 fungal-type domain-containing protein n=1 Tax=Fusarium oxysporum f. sp. melonis 26406 TaxID=1089452 RepID=X0A001_FUSOX|nr:hypothetical protein FOMG_16794 [Fusarium oxysporum f. sp. melonis 26406]
MAPEQQRSPRILACVPCHQRKKKCDRKSPCSFRTKAGIECIPSTPAPKRSHRKPVKEILARLDRCEELLKKCTCVQKPWKYVSLKMGNIRVD